MTGLPMDRHDITPVLADECRKLAARLGLTEEDVLRRANRWRDHYRHKEVADVRAAG